MIAHADDGTGYVHESVHKDDPSRYTRPWFAWVNSLYSELLIKTFASNFERNDSIRQNDFAYFNYEEER